MVSNDGKRLGSALNSLLPDGQTENKIYVEKRVAMTTNVRTWFLCHDKISKFQ